MDTFSSLTNILKEKEKGHAHQILFLQRITKFWDKFILHSKWELCKFQYEIDHHVHDDTTHLSFDEILKHNVIKTEYYTEEKSLLLKDNLL